MFKTFVFIRGVDSPLKRQVVSAVMGFLNPDVNHIRAYKLALTDYCDPRDKAALKAADRTCKNIAKKLLQGSSYQENFIVVDNESLLPQHWLSYLDLGESISVNTIGVGVDVVDENITDEGLKAKLNLQEQKLPLFIATTYKYIRVQSDTEIPEIFEGLKQLEKGI